MSPHCKAGVVISLVALAISLAALSMSLLAMGKF